MFNSGTPLVMPVAPAYEGGRSNDGMFGNDWSWIIILLLFGLFGGNGFGFGGFGGYGGGRVEAVATQADLAAGFNNSAVLSNLNDIILGQAGIQQTLCQGFGGINTAIGNLGYNVQGGINSLSSQMASCCCDTQRQIERGFADTNYNMATQACETRQAIADSTRSILDFLTQDKIATLTAENQSLKFAASQSRQNDYLTATLDAKTAEIIRRTGNDCPVPAYVVQPPAQVTFPTNCCGQFSGFGYGYGSGCGCGC